MSGNGARRVTPWKALGLLALAAAAADLVLALTGGYHAHLALENVPLFGAVTGLLAALGIAGLARLLGARLLERGEDYYHD